MAGKDITDAPQISSGDFLKVVDAALNDKKIALQVNTAGSGQKPKNETFGFDGATQRTAEEFQNLATGLMEKVTPPFSERQKAAILIETAKGGEMSLEKLNRFAAGDVKDKDVNPPVPGDDAFTKDLRNALAPSGPPASAPKP